jgi:dTMP kinase
MPSSEHRGLFVSVDGPSAAGKSTIVEHLAQLLVASGEEVHVTAEPSNGPIGILCRELTETVSGYEPAVLPGVRDVIVARRRVLAMPWCR